MEKRDLEGRLFLFAVNTIRYLKTLNETSEIKVIKYQLSKSATSSGANYEEAQGGSSKSDFLNKVRISLKEMRESNYWIRILNDLKVGDCMEREKLLNESEELKKILGSIASHTLTGTKN